MEKEFLNKVEGRNLQRKGQHNNLKRRCKKMLLKLKGEQPIKKEYFQYIWWNINIYHIPQTLRSQHPVTMGKEHEQAIRKIKPHI